MSDKNKLQKILSVLKGTPKTITLEEKQIQKLQDEVNKLKELNDIDTQFDIDMLLEQKASFPMFQWQNKLVAQYHFFITVLGMIDSNLDDCQHQITFFLILKM